MYHTFQTATATPGPSDLESGKKASRRISTTNACGECKRRKIRCDGSQPCSQCQWYQHPQICAYSKPTQRVVPSRKAMDRLQSQVDQYGSIFSRLFPGQDLETVVALPREDLVNLAVTLLAPTTSPSIRSEPTPAVARSQDNQKSEDADSLEALEQAPERDPEMDEAMRHKDKVNAISDDVNGLSLSVDRQSSYVGILSISAALKVIFKTAPMVRPYIVQSYTETAPPSRSNSPPPHFRDVDPYYLPPADIGQELIESYFTHVHVLMPMIDEDHLWHTYLYAERRDSAWLALLNMVMALGSLARSTCDNEEHFGYFQRARKHLDLESLGSGNVLVLQALGLLSGYYLHWLNRPNEANNLMGATLRMATALGLHREYNDSVASRPTSGPVRAVGLEVPAEIRRRTWWSLFCLDSWASTATGRPSLGRMGPGVTVTSPKIPQQMNNAQYIASLRLLPIIHNIDFCKLATRIQDTLAARSLCKFEELFALDAELVRWHDELPPILRDILDRPPMPARRTSASTTSYKTPPALSTRNPFDFAQPPDRDRTTCPEVLKTPRAIMHWRYQNLRMLMHRPFLLAAALRGTPYADMNAEEKVIVGRCRIIAGQTIADIAATCREELIAGWNAVWLMYQAVMVPLVSLFAHISSPSVSLGLDSPSLGLDDPEGSTDGADKWRQQIETALQFFEKMRRYSVAAKKSKDVVERLYAASKHVQKHPEQHQQYSATTKPAQIEIGMPQVFDAQDFSSVPFNSQDYLQNSKLEQSIWGLSPNGDAAMNSFWDDMMWDTFPATEDWMQGLDQFDWTMPGDQQTDPAILGTDLTQ